jgi:adenine phosphoribosyltransferase
VVALNLHTIKIAGLERNLPICAVSDELSIAAFLLYSDVEMTVRCAAELLTRVPEFDAILVPEAKGIPLAYEMSKQSGKPYYTASKKQKVYMREPVSVRVQSITTLDAQHLYIDKAQGLAGKRLLIVDDVISTGGTLSALEDLAEAIGAKIAGKAAILAEGEAANRTDILYLEKLPIFFSKPY